MGTASAEVAVRSLPRPVRWLIWMAAAVLVSVAAGFVVGLARPRVKA
jgi:hypothetical protein